MRRIIIKRRIVGFFESFIVLGPFFIKTIIPPFTIDYKPLNNYIVDNLSTTPATTHHGTKHNLEGGFIRA